MNAFSHVPPGFRFHPTDEELVDYYLRKKVTLRRIDLDIIKDVDLYKIEPWDLEELCRLGTEEQNEWYFFSHKDKKYPTGTRTNRATAAGFWKATGRDKAIYSKHDLVGMRKTLVFYKGRAPNGQKSDWIMHEYRLETDENNGTPQEEGWVVCKVFKKRIATIRKVDEHESPCWYDDQISFMPELDSPNQISHSNLTSSNHNFPYSSCKKELDLNYRIHHEHFLHMKMMQAAGPISCNNSNMAAYCLDINHGSASITQEEQIQHAHEQNMHNIPIYGDNNCNVQGVDQVMDWRVLDKFVASQFGQGDATIESNYQIAAANASASTSSCPIDMWK